MKLVDIRKIPKQEHESLNLVAGVDQGKLVMVAKKKSDREWILFQNAGQGHLNKESLIKLGSLSSLEDILAYYQGKNLKPCSPRQQPGPARASATSPVSVRNMAERRFYRKQVNLNGEYRNPRTGSIGSILVADVSFKGLKFTTIGPHDTQPGDRLQVSFILDNSKQSVIKRKVMAKHVQANDIGAEFINPPEYDKELGFYLI